MEVGCLLELQDGDILGAGGLLQQCVSDLDTAPDEVVQILMGVQHATPGTTDSLPSAMDFEFSNSDLEAGTDFSIDHSSVFDSITESDLDERGDNHFLFNDSSILDPTQKQPPIQQIKIHSSDAIYKTFNLTQEGHLNLQIIPLNNLKVVSAIQTSDGIQYIALPQEAEIQSTKISPTSLVSNVPITSKRTHDRVQNIQCTPNVSVRGMEGLPSDDYAIGTTGDNIVAVDAGVEEAKIIHIDELHNFNGLPFVSQVENSNFVLTNNVLSTVDHLTSVVPPILSCDYIGPGVNQAALLSETSVLFESGANNHSTDTTSYSQSINLVGVAPKQKHMVSLLSSPIIDKLLKDNLEMHKSRKDVAVKFQIETENGVKAIPTASLSKIKLVNSQDGIKLHQETTTAQQHFEEHTCRLNEMLTSTGNRNSQSGDSQKVELLSSKNYSEVDKNNVIITSLKTPVPGNRSLLRVDESSHTVEPKHKHSKLENTDVPGTSVFKCNICESQFEKIGCYMRHMELHESRTDCLPDIDVTEPILDIPDIDTNNLTDGSNDAGPSVLSEVVMTKINSKKGLESNSREAVGDTISGLRCDVCLATFTNPGNMKRHKLIHEAKSQENYRFECGSCGRRFLQKCDLKRHQLIHTNDLPYLCTKCGKGYIRRSDLVVHERFHSQERGFKCPHCVKSYTQSSDLHRHIRQIHLPRSELSCPRCKVSFTKLASLEKHIHTKHQAAAQLNEQQLVTEPGLADHIHDVAGMTDHIHDVAGMTDHIDDVAGMTDQIHDVAGMTDHIHDVAGMTDHIHDVAGMTDQIHDVARMTDHIHDVAGMTDHIHDVAGMTELDINDHLTCEAIQNLQQYVQQLGKTSGN